MHESNSKHKLLPILLGNGLHIAQIICWKDFAPIADESPTCPPLSSLIWPPSTGCSCHIFAWHPYLCISIHALLDCCLIHCPLLCLLLSARRHHPCPTSCRCHCRCCCHCCRRHLHCHCHHHHSPQCHRCQCCRLLGEREGVVGVCHLQLWLS